MVDFYYLVCHSCKEFIQAFSPGYRRLNFIELEGDKTVDIIEWLSDHHLDSIQLISEHDVEDLLEKGYKEVEAEIGDEEIIFKEVKRDLEMHAHMTIASGRLVKRLKKNVR